MAKTNHKDILITTSSFAEYDRKPLELLERSGFRYSLNPYGRKLTKEELFHLVGDAVGIIAGTEELNADVLRGMPKVRVISRCGAGLDNVDLKTAREMSIIVTNTPDSVTIAVAELTVGLILTLLRKVCTMDHQLKTGQWNKMMGNLLYGKKVGIVGFGRIGQKVSELLSVFEVEMAFYDIVKKSSKSVKYKPLLELCSWADILCLHASRNENKYLLGEEEIVAMKQGGWLVNCARGGLVDEKILYESLKSGKLQGAAMDVFEREPYSGPLREIENIILTPHIGSYAREARVAMEFEAVENLIQGLKSRKKPAAVRR